METKQQKAAGWRTFIVLFVICAVGVVLIANSCEARREREEARRAAAAEAMCAAEMFNLIGRSVQLMDPFFLIRDDAERQEPPTKSNGLIYDPPPPKYPGFI